MPGSIAHSFVRAFKSIGWQASLFALSPAGAQGNGLLARARARVAAHARKESLNRSLAAEARRLGPDLTLVLKGHRLSAETIRAVREASSMGAVNYYPDDPFSESRVNRAGAGVLREYSACFTFARHLLPSYSAAGVKRAFYLPFARDPDLHSPPAETHHEFDAVFVGNLDADRVSWLESIADYRIAIFGQLTKTAVPSRSRLAGATFFEPVFGHDLVAALSRGKVSLNFMRQQNILSHNMRSFESPACNAFTLSQRTPELLALFDDGIEIDTFAERAELRDRLDAALHDDERRARISAAGFARVEHDTYARRAETILANAG
jgi:spore maturation protein CgeB